MRYKGTTVYAEPGYLTCGYTKDTSIGLAAAASIFLIFGQMLNLLQFKVSGIASS
ncbi:hypothetical protein M758_UG128700 [Ceratodon purpureus]|nr:hypothetical protein M758_UG128700 [Ceratodon purpureus]